MQFLSLLNLCDDMAQLFDFHPEFGQDAGREAASLLNKSEQKVLRSL